jgi:hypothetical protein
MMRHIQSCHYSKQDANTKSLCITSFCACNNYNNNNNNICHAQNRKSLLGAHFKVCGAATAAHPTVGTVCVITMCGGFGPKPLDISTVVSVDAGESPTAQFNRVLESIPVPQVSFVC